MSEPVAMQIAAAFTRWRCKARGVYSVLHHSMSDYVKLQVLIIKTYNSPVGPYGNMARVKGQVSHTVFSEKKVCRNLFPVTFIPSA